MRHLTEHFSLFCIGCLVGEGIRPTNAPGLCEGQTTPAPLELVVYRCPNKTRPSQNVRQGIVLEVSPASASMNEESGQQLNLKVPKGGLVLKMCMVYVRKSS